MALKKLFKKFKYPSAPEDPSQEFLPAARPKKPNRESVLLAKLAPAVMQFVGWFQIRAQPMLRQFDWTLIRRCCFLVVISFVVASSVSTFAANYALNFSTKAGSKSGGKGGAKGTETAELELLPSISAPASEGPSASELKRGILARNIFNSAGELAPEAQGDSRELTKTKGLDFASVPCTDEKLPVEVLGTIFIGDPLKSVVSVKDPKISDTDAYRAGDLIIEHEEYEVFRVFRGLVEFRKGDEKICVYLKGFNDPAKTAAVSEVENKDPSKGAVKPENVETLNFDANIVQQEIGPGYANILNSAKLIPEVEPSGKVAGFKIIAISSGSLFDKMKLQNGDVLNEVNGVSLKDASQGFKLYQSLQEEREITVNFLRNNEPMVRKVLVK